MQISNLKLLISVISAYIIVILKYFFFIFFKNFYCGLFFGNIGKQTSLFTRLKPAPSSNIKMQYQSSSLVCFPFIFFSDSYIPSNSLRVSVFIDLLWMKLKSKRKILGRGASYYTPEEPNCSGKDNSNIYLVSLYSTVEITGLTKLKTTLVNEAISY